MNLLNNVLSNNSISNNSISNNSISNKTVAFKMKKTAKEKKVLNNSDSKLYSKYFSSKYFLGIICLYCFGCLFLLKPFGMEYLYGWELVLHALFFEFAIIVTSFLMLGIYNVSVPCDKIGVPFLAVAIILFCSISIYFCSLFIHSQELTDYFAHKRYILILRDCIIIGILPAILTWILFDKIFYSTYYKKANKINEDFELNRPTNNNETITLTGKNMDNRLVFNVSDLIYIKAEENYCFIFFKKNGRIHRRFFRSSLSALYEQVKGPDRRNIVRCHRTYIVNLDHVLEMHGNSRGYHLQLKYDNAEIPVSRNFPDVFLLKKRYGCKKYNYVGL